MKDSTVIEVTLREEGEKSEDEIPEAAASILKQIHSIGESITNVSASFKMSAQTSCMMIHVAVKASPQKLIITFNFRVLIASLPKSISTLVSSPLPSP